MIHIDSCILRGMLDADDDRGNRREAIHLLNSSSDLCFRVSIVAIGEVVGKMAESNNTTMTVEAAARLSKLFRGHRLELYGMGRGSNAMLVADEIMDADHLITPSDAFLVACALGDGECTGFATMDHLLIKSIAVISRASARGLRIIDVRTDRKPKRASYGERPVNMKISKIDPQIAGA